MENKEDKKDYCYFCDPETRGKFTWIGELWTTIQDKNFLGYFVI